jgi:hypothetical protein
MGQMVGSVRGLLIWSFFGFPVAIAQKRQRQRSSLDEDFEEIGEIFSARDGHNPTTGRRIELGLRRLT